jgi:hypothetical protein
VTLPCAAFFFPPLKCAPPLFLFLPGPAPPAPPRADVDEQMGVSLLEAAEVASDRTDIEDESSIESSSSSASFSSEELMTVTSFSSSTFADVADGLCRFLVEDEDEAVGAVSDTILAKDEEGQPRTDSDFEKEGRCALRRYNSS